MLTKSSFQEVEKMQSSYSLIKKASVKQGEHKVVSTKYISKNPVSEQIEEEKNEDEIKKK